MKQMHLSLIAAAAVLALFTGCSDPADSVHKSAASAPQESSGDAPIAGKTYVIRPESKIAFIGSKVTGKHDGGFTNFSGTLSVADGKIVGSPKITIQMDSTWSDNGRLTGHLKSADFFDVEKFPVSTFTVTAIESAEGEGGQKITGNLELHGVTKSISFPAQVQVAEDAVTVKADFAINRKDFNIVYSGKSDDLIRDDVVLKLDITAAPEG